MNYTSERIKKVVRGAGGIVHSDGNIFFTDGRQFAKAVWGFFWRWL